MVVRIGSGGPFEDLVGYSRAVAAGDHVHVSGCTAIVDGVLRGEGDMYAQTRHTIGNIAAALERLGASLADVVRTRIFVTDLGRWEEVARAHGEAFGQIRPAASLLGVAGLIDPRLLVEIEADAYRPGVGG